MLILHKINGAMLQRAIFNIIMKNEKAGIIKLFAAHSHPSVTA